ncbi:MAG: DoxX family protein [Bacteroidales bacterium]|nr:DoxX family protein [Bacteroidales bacterium]
MIFLVPAAFCIAMFFILAEFTIGLALIFRVRIKETVSAALVFILFFTVLTLIIAFTNPVSDCGCFGDAVILSNWQTFYKNLVLLLLIVFLVWYEFRDHQPADYTGEWLWLGGFALVMLLTSVYCYRHLPLLDFRPYRIGTYIPDKMKLPEGVLPLESKMLLYYEKDGVVEEFTEDNYPWQDSTWKWKETKTVVIKENKAEIHDFVLTDAETGEEVTDSLLYRADDVFLLVTYDLEKAKKRQLKRANELAAWCSEHGFAFYALTSTGPADIQRFKRELGLDYAFANADEIMLKTVIRANPGLVYLHRGVIMDKWHGNDLPKVSAWSGQPLAEAATHRRHMTERRVFWLYGGLALLTLGLFMVYAVSFRKKKR